MKKIDLTNWNRLKTYEWFKSFTNSTYGINSEIDVTELVNYVKSNNQSFFIALLYIVLKGLNSVEEMRMRLVNNKPVLYENINPAFTVMTTLGTYENVRYENIQNYKEFYNISSKYIEDAKHEQKIKKENYNPENCYNEYYITCLPWLNFTGLTHPMPDDKASQCIPRICWGKYTKKNDRYILTLNITVSHIFVDGYPLSKVFNNIQEYLNNVNQLLK